MSLLPRAFAPRLIAWQRAHGRHGLPWQGTRDPYRVWLSEVMLQQTQVATVLDYFPRFLDRFPDVQALAAATADEVMGLWSGLGYYSRARNLHRCAQTIVSEHAGVFPDNAVALARLPGIGASTAAAIAAFCFGERVSIVDGNVRRVLTRVMAYDHDLSGAAAQRGLWDAAQGLLPTAPDQHDMAAYTQGLMDLGATVCLRSKPLCTACPMSDLCSAHARGEPERFPVRTRKVQRRFERWWLLLLTREDAIWLQRRPDRGIWSGLHAPPVFSSEQDLLDAVGPDRATGLRPWEPLAHSLTHRELQLLPMHLAMNETPSALEGAWVPSDRVVSLGLPAPVRALLQRL